MTTIFRLTILERSQSLTRLDQLTRNLRRILTGRMVLSNKSRLHPGASLLDKFVYLDML
jgi:hypothetical protein